MVNSSGVISTIAGNHTSGYTGDGGQATSAELGNPFGVVFDAFGDLLITTPGSKVIREVFPNGVIVTVAGNGTAGYTGDGGPAISAELHGPFLMAFNSLGNLYFADATNNVIRGVTATASQTYTVTVNPTTTTLASSLPSGPLGSNVTFTAEVSSAVGVPTGTVLFEDGSTVLGSATLAGGVATLSTSNLSQGEHLIRAVYSGVSGVYYVSTSSGVAQSSTIATVAGNHTQGYSGDGGQATLAELSSPVAVAFDSLGNMYISDNSNYVIRKVTPSGVISTVVGNGTMGYSGDGGPVTSAEIGSPEGMAFDSAGDLFFADYADNVVREVNTAGIISTVAGTGTSNFSGDGGPAVSAELNQPVDVAFNAEGDLFISDSGNSVIREVNTSGVINTIAGIGTSTGYSGDGGPATSALLGLPYGMAFDSSGDLFFADPYDNVVREVNTAGVINTVAGNGTAGYSGDNGPATSAELGGPTSIAFNAFGDMFIDEGLDNVIREVSPSGFITTAVANGSIGYSGNGGPAIESSLYGPVGLGMNSSGSLYIADTNNNAIREVAAAPLFNYAVSAPTATLSLHITTSPQSTTFSVNVDTASGSPVNGGTVSFYDGTTLLGAAEVVNGVAVFDDAALSPGIHSLSAVFSGTEEAGASTAYQSVTVATPTGTPSVVGLSRYPVNDNRTLVSLFFDQTLNPAEALWKHNYKLYTGSSGNIKISHIYFDTSTNTVTLLPAKRLALRNTYTLKLLGLNSKSISKGFSPTVASNGWLATNFKAEINHHALSLPGASPAIGFVNGQEVATRW